MVFLYTTKKKKNRKKRKKKTKDKKMECKFSACKQTGLNLALAIKYN